MSPTGGHTRVEGGYGLCATQGRRGQLCSAGPDAPRVRTLPWPPSGKPAGLMTADKLLQLAESMVARLMARDGRLTGREAAMMYLGILQAQVGRPQPQGEGGGGRGLSGVLEGWKI